MSDIQKAYITRLSGGLRKDFEFYKSEQGLNDADALRECIKSHVRNKHTSPDIQTRLRTIEMELKELNKKL